MTRSYSELFRVFGRIGLMSFGGPAAQIALMHRELVEERDWLDEDGFLRALSLCMLLPGPEAMQLATYAGWRQRGVAGGLIAGGLFVLPGAAVIAALVLHQIVGERVEAVILAFAPGGLAEMSLVALSMHISALYVSTHHVARIVLAITVARLFSSRIPPED